MKQDRLNSNLTENYSYDELDRLTGANSAVYGNKFYRYNQINNILEKDTRVYQYDVAHPYAVVNDGRYTYTYDANGNIVGRSDGRVITWDYDNRVKSISDGGSFVYGAGFRRIKKVENGVTTLYFFKNYEEEYQGGNKTKSVKYYFANGMRIAENSSTDGLKFYHQDHLGSSSAVSDANGNLVMRMAYKPYGGVAFSEGIGGVRYTFTGKELDNSDLYYFGARYYDPELGRFISVDPLGDGLNWYAYCNDNPVIYIDPTGLWSFSSMCSSIGSAISSVCSSIGHAVSSVCSAVGKAVSSVTGGGSNGGKTKSNDTPNVDRIMDNLNKTGYKQIQDQLNHGYPGNPLGGGGNGGYGRLQPPNLNKSIEDSFDEIRHPNSVSTPDYRPLCGGNMPWETRNNFQIEPVSNGLQKICYGVGWISLGGLIIGSTDGVASVLGVPCIIYGKVQIVMGIAEITYGLTDQGTMSEHYGIIDDMMSQGRPDSF